jgi:hypothetical protein
MQHIALVGRVQCIRKDDCIGLNVSLNEVGLTDHPNKFKKIGKIDNEGFYVFPRLVDEKIYNVSIE